MGRNPKPQQLQILKGNKNRKTKQELDRLQKAEEKVQFKSDNIKPPSWLNAEAKKVFKKLVKDFEGTGLLVNVDIYAHHFMFCNAYCDYLQFTEIIETEGYMIQQTNKTGATNDIAHPLLAKKNTVFA